MKSVLKHINSDVGRTLLAGEMKVGYKFRHPGFNNNVYTVVSMVHPQYELYLDVIDERGRNFNTNYDAYCVIVEVPEEIE